jgi:hypothetical protein
VVNVASGLCLEVASRAVNEAPIDQWPCSTISNEVWSSGTNFVELRSRVSGTNSHCLDVPGSQPVNGLAMQLYECNGTSAQVWQQGGFPP